MLFPAAFLIMLVLGSLAIDAGAVFVGQRDLASAAGAAANDATTLGLNLERLRDDGTLVLDPGLVESSVLATLGRRGIADQLAAPPEIEIAGDQISVTLTRHVAYVIAPALPGAPAGRTVTVTARASAITDS